MNNNTKSANKILKKDQKINSLAIRLTVWFLILSTLPLVVMVFFIRGNITEKLREAEIEFEQRRNKEMAISLSEERGLENVVPILSASSSPAKTFFILEYNGEIAYHPNPEIINSTLETITSAIDIEEVRVNYDGYLIEPKTHELIVYTPIPNTRYFLMSINNDPAIFSTVTNLERRSLAQLGISLLIISVLAGMMIWYIVGNPIRILTDAATKISQGDLDVKVDLEPMTDELLVLGSTFNQMAFKLKANITGLENNLKNLQEAQAELKNSENRYRTIFDTASVSIWEEDVTEFLSLVEELKTDGVTDFRQYFDQHPDFLLKLFHSVKVTDVNNQTLAIYGANSKEELLGSLNKIYLPEMLEAFKEEAIAICNGATQYEAEIVNLTLTGKKIQTLMRLTLPETDAERKTMLVSIMDISEQKESSLRIQKQVEHLSALRQIDLAIASHLDLRSIITLLLSQIRNQLNVDAVNVLRFNAHLNTLDFVSSIGFRTNALQNTNLRLGEGFAGRAALERRSLFIQDLSEQTNPFKNAPYFSQERFVSYYGIPLIAKGEVKGVLEVFHRAPLSINQEWEEFVKDLATQAALAIDAANLWEEQQRANEELKIAYDSTLKGWSMALELHDYETYGHSDRVTKFAVELAHKMGIRDEKLTHIRRGAILHDIGKIGVDKAILNKPGKLNDEERLAVQKHPEYARRLLAPIDFLKPAIDIPYYHHEWWNGGGYPEGLSGEAIPLSARIFAVIDVWDALSNARPYREAWPKEKVMQYINDLSGMQFDPNVVQHFLDMVENW